MISPDLLNNVKSVDNRKRQDLLANRDLHFVVLSLDIEAELFKSRYNGHPRVEPFHTLQPGVRSGSTKMIKKTNLELRSSVGVEGAIIIEDVDKFKLVADANLVIIGVVGRGDFHSTSSERHIDDDVVCNDGDFAVGDEGVFSKFAVEMLESL